MFFCFSRTLLDVFYTGTQISDTSGKPFANFPLLWTLLEVQVLCSVMSYRLVCFCPYLEGTVVLPKVGDYTIYHPVQRNMAENFNLQRQLCESHNAKSLHGFECFLSESRRITSQLDATCYFTLLLIDPTCFGHYYVHHKELATMLLNYHIGRFVPGLLCVGG